MYKVVTLDRETNRENLSVVPAYLAGAEDRFPHEEGAGDGNRTRISSLGS